MTNGAQEPSAFDVPPNCEFLYTPLDVAQAEIRRRWRDPSLKKAVLSFLDGQLPPLIGNAPCAWLARHIKSPTLECAQFLRLATDAHLTPICSEFTVDKFVTRNLDKYRLAKMYFHFGNGHNNSDRIETVKIIDFNSANGRRLDEITTLWGESFVGFHHRLSRESFPSFSCDSDVSDWMRLWGTIQAAYTRYFALLTCFSVLFENFSLNGREGEFTRTVVLPAFHATVARFGVKPLIVRLMPPETEYDLYWYCYPAALKPIVDASLCGNDSDAETGNGIGGRRAPPRRSPARRSAHATLEALPRRPITEEIGLHIAAQTAQPGKGMTPP